MKKLIGFSALLILVTSCSMFTSLTSNTTIDPQKSFVLGNNEHKGFVIKLKNTSMDDVVLHRAPISGGRHSFVTVKPSESVKVKVESNTALVIDNKSTDTASVRLHIKGDTGLSMNYKNN